MTQRPEAEIARSHQPQEASRELNLVALQPTESGPRTRGGAHGGEGPSLPPITIENSTESNTHNNNHSTGIGIGHGGEGGKSRSDSRSNSHAIGNGGDGGDARSNSNAIGTGGDARSDSNAIGNGGDGGHGGDGGEGGRGGSAHINDNSRTEYIDKSIFLNPVQVPEQHGDGIKVFSSVTMRHGSNTISVDSGVDSRTFSAGVAIPGIVGITAGGGSADIPHEGQRQVQAAGNLMKGQTALFWGDALGRRQSTRGIGAQLTEGGATVIQNELNSTQQ